MNVWLVWKILWFLKIKNLVNLKTVINGLLLMRISADLIQQFALIALMDSVFGLSRTYANLARVTSLTGTGLTA